MFQLNLNWQRDLKYLIINQLLKFIKDKEQDKAKKSFNGFHGNHYYILYIQICMFYVISFPSLTYNSDLKQLLQIDL